jgi:hypothetical protein
MEPSKEADEIIQRNKRRLQKPWQRQDARPREPIDHEAEASWHFKWAQAEQVEEAMMTSLQQLKTTDRIVLFPPVRSCNAVLATFEDAGDYFRAL